MTRPGLVSLRTHDTSRHYYYRCRLNSRISGDEIHTSSWMPGTDWSGTVFEPIYSAACLCDHDSSAKFFGLILWEVVKDHDKTWSYWRYDKNGIPIKGLTYFRLQNPPAR